MKKKTTPDQVRRAGEFSSWLRSTRRGLKEKSSGADVPCGACTACCHSSMFIHIRPEETQALKRIPPELVFPAPGLPKGNVLMGYDEKGRCPMFIGGKCSIYEYRPQTCRDFDCRIFAATGIELNEQAQTLIAETAKQWEFEFVGDEGREDFAAVRAAAEFLMENKGLFPGETLPRHPAKLASVAILVYDVFRDINEATDRKKERPSDAEIAKAVLEAMAPLAMNRKNT